MHELMAAVRAEVHEMVAWKAPPGADLGPEAASAEGSGEPRPDEESGSFVTIAPMREERLHESQVPEVKVTVVAGLLRVEARGRVLEVELDEPIYHYEPDGMNPGEHAGWLAELWMEDAV